MPEASKTVMLDHKKMVEDKKRISAIASSPDHEELIPIYINPKTTIFCKPGEDPQEKKRKFLQRLAERDNQLKKKNINDKKFHYN